MHLRGSAPLSRERQRPRASLVRGRILSLQIADGYLRLLRDPLSRCVVEAQQTLYPCCAGIAVWQVPAMLLRNCHCASVKPLKVEADPASALAKRITNLPRSFHIVAVQIDRRRRDGRMPQVVSHSGQLCAALQSMGGVRMPHPMWTGLSELLSQHRVIAFNHVGRRQEEPFDHISPAGHTREASVVNGCPPWTMACARSKIPSQCLVVDPNAGAEPRQQVLTSRDAAQRECEASRRIPVVSQVNGVRTGCG